MNAFKLAKYKSKGEAILRDLKLHPEKQVKLEKCLRANGFDEIADLALALKKDFM